MIEQCGGCRFYQPDETGGEKGTGVCRRYPPGARAASEHESTHSLHPDGFIQPTVWDDAWCGEYQPAATTPPDFEAWAYEVPNRVRRAIRREKVTTWDGLLAEQPAYWMNFGAVSLGELVAAMRAAGVTVPTRDGWR